MVRIVAPRISLIKAAISGEVYQNPLQQQFEKPIIQEVASSIHTIIMVTKHIK